MKYRLILFALFAAILASAQERSATPLPTQNSNPKTQNSTRAVVVGISDYADERIPDLQYAHKDAEAFAVYLRAPAGGSLPDDRIVVLTNSAATAGKIIAALEWLIAESVAGDRVLLYFSGHGDVERVTKFQRGYLLAYDAPGTTYAAGGSLPVGLFPR
ncbi:MAG: caspase family protein [Saprospiraceae bacterium]|nr:caspase family protein [Saprospiraceae bacterium]